MDQVAGAPEPSAYPARVISTRGWSVAAGTQDAARKLRAAPRSIDVVTARVGVVTFPGSLDDRDAARAVALAGAEPVPLWHGDTDLHGVDAVVLPGGFSYGDYLRCGAIARFAPVMEPLIDAGPRTACRCSASATASRCSASRTCCPAR